MDIKFICIYAAVSKKHSFKVQAQHFSDPASYVFKINFGLKHYWWDTMCNSEGNTALGVFSSVTVALMEISKAWHFSSEWQHKKNIIEANYITTNQKKKKKTQ